MKAASFILVGILMFTHEGISQEKTAQTSVEQNADKLRNRPRMGMTEEQLTLLWGNPVGDVNPQFYGESGVKKQHEKFFPVSFFGKTYRTDDIMLETGLVDGKVIAITIRSFGEPFTYEESEKIAKTITGTGFARKPRNKDSFSVYSTDMRQKYLLSKIGSYCCQVVDMEALSQIKPENDKEREKEKAKDSKLDQSLQKL